ncbi:NAD(P)/FAD-dependent oxidoreductase [Ferrimonas kyonanensis]|uniref:NAD(P)/FAD-dependent oxidoreductase n=1 Tax=Ferrimonas kyonanensis TaxID=364763 RepID=UPI00054DD61D|nr:FAD-dependent oxidoreductase [Ferrimonas kyonanensis]
MEQPHTFIIGAGIIGLTQAWILSLAGDRVTVVDREEPGRGASFGNAGHFATEQVFPLADPALLPQVPAMLMDPLGPFRIRGGYCLKALPWLMRFVANMTPARRRHNQAAITALNRRAMEDWQGVLAECGQSQWLQQQGSLLVYEQTAIAEQQRQARTFAEAGVICDWLDAAQLHQLEPGLSSTLSGALWFPETGHTLDPYGVCRGLMQTLLQRGVRFERGQVTAVTPEAAITLADGRQFQADRLVVAAGAWSAALAAQLGYRVPLEAERGYHLMLTQHSGLRRPVSSAERKFIITPMAAGTRLAGTVEFAGRDAPMNPRRADILLHQGKALLPQLNVRQGQGERWMGCRPSLPDSLPVIGGCHHRRCFFSFGHQHLGLTQAATSARLLGQLMAGQATDLDLSPYAIHRF